MTVVIKGLTKEDVIGLRATFRENVTVLQPHGRLIDEDAIYNCDMLYRFITYQGNWVYSRKAIQYAPTIIDAEGEP